MPNTRKKVIKTVYKDEESEGETGDFSDSGSDAQISEPPTSDEEEIEEKRSSADEFDKKSVKKRPKQLTKRKTKFAKEFITKLNKQPSLENEDHDSAPTLINIKDLTDADKLLPSSLNLSESDSSDEDTPKSVKKVIKTMPHTLQQSDHEEEEYTDVWSNVHDNSAELAKRTFMELEQHKNTIEETKASLQDYVHKSRIMHDKESNVKDLLALGEDIEPTTSPKKKRKPKKGREDSESEVEDWEEVKESKGIPQQGLQLVVALPDSVCRKSKKVDVEMMMKRKINRVKKENQVFMHKVHVLCWLGHGNFVSRNLNDQKIMEVVHALVPKGCYPKDRLDLKYVEQITAWYKEKFILKPDKHENKFRPKAPPLKDILLDQIKKKAFTSYKYLVFVFVAMLRALGLQCRVMFNFVTVPLKPSVLELCSLSTKPKTEKGDNNKVDISKAPKNKAKTTGKNKQTIAQVDGVIDLFSSDSEYENIMQVDGNDDMSSVKTRGSRAKKMEVQNINNVQEEGVSPPKRSKKVSETKVNAKKLGTSKSPLSRKKGDENDIVTKTTEKNNSNASTLPSLNKEFKDKTIQETKPPEKVPHKSLQVRKTRSSYKTICNTSDVTDQNKKKLDVPKITFSNYDQENIEVKGHANPESTKQRSSRKRSHTADSDGSSNPINAKSKVRNKSSTGISDEKSKYFDDSASDTKKPKLSTKKLKQQEQLEDGQRVSHRDLTKPKTKTTKDVTGDLIDIIKTRIKSVKENAKQGIVKGKLKQSSDDDSDYLSVQDAKRNNSDSDEDFKPTKISPRAPKVSPGAKPSTSKKIDRRVFSTDDELKKNNVIDNSKKVNVWCEIFVEELEQWIPVDIVKGKVHCAGELYSHATHPVCYIVGWDNNNYLKDLTRRYVPHWNTVTRKQRAELSWWQTAVSPWLGPRNAKDKEEDEALERMQIEAPLPKSIAEYKNHPLYALKRHLLKFEALYPPDAATLGFVRNEAVYARDCVYICRSRDTWLKEAKVVKLGEIPYKIVKARPKWDKLSNKLITDKPLEVFGPWQVQDYEPPTAEDGKVPRNAYGNVELFKDCMLPKGTVHIKLPGLNKVARKLNIDCAPAMTGFDFNGGWSHPVYDGFVVCKEFEELITEAWLKDQEEQERREIEKLELRVYGNWKRLIKGLLIRERLKLKYGFEEPGTSGTTKNKSKGPRLVVKKKF